MAISPISAHSPQSARLLEFVLLQPAAEPGLAEPELARRTGLVPGLAVERLEQVTLLELSHQLLECPTPLAACLELRPLLQVIGQRIRVQHLPGGHGEQ